MIFGKNENIGFCAKTVSLAFALAGFAPTLNAQDRSSYPTFMFDLTYGLTTMKSKLVESNDTGSSLNYSLGGFAGSDQQIEYNIGFEKDAASFQLNDSTIAYDWQDTKLRYHLGMFYAGLVFTRLNMEMTRAGEDIIDAAGSGYGGTLGFLTDIGKRGMFRIDVTSVSLPKLKNVIAGEAAVPSRLDIDIGASIDLYGKWSNFNFGYRMRTIGVKADVSASDTESSTYIGFRIMTKR
ncbi:MAG: hypothetical protein EOP10_04500 [Proteobacteria bacterium]|nr:MAG: hypothetical protein EOP10_04500 [Pseudomonadota bacterium]